MASLRQLKNDTDPSFELHESGPLWFGDRPASTASVTPGFAMPTYVPEATSPAAQPKAPSYRPRIGGGGGGTAAARTTTTTRKPTTPAPVAPTIPAFVAPEWDEKAIGRLAQKKAAPRLRSLRRQMQREAGRQYENPNVKRMTLRQAMEGYGLGLGSVMAEAEGAGRAEYGQKYSKEFAGAQATYAAKTQVLMQSYQNAFTAYMASMQQTTETGPSKSSGEPEMRYQIPGMGSTGFTVPQGKDTFGRSV